MFSVSQETCGVATHTRGTGGSLGASAGLENAVVRVNQSVAGLLIRNVPVHSRQRPGDIHMTRIVLRVQKLTTILTARADMPGRTGGSML